MSARRAGEPSSLLTDHYELTMLDAALRSGVARYRCVFEVFARRLPPGRRYGVVGGTGRLAECLDTFRFGAEEIGWLRHRGAFSEAAVGFLERFRFSGDIHGFEEGEVYFPNEPLLTVAASFAEAVLLETVVLSILNHDSAVAAAASRMSSAAGGRPLVEMGSRRTHELAAVAAARAAYLGGFAATSNLEAGRRYAIPTAGTSGHAFTLAHPSEPEAFEAQVAALGVGTTLLVDTYDVEEGVRSAVEVCRRLGATGPGAVRIDSGDLAQECRRVRDLLDTLGATQTNIVVTGDLDEYAIEALERSPAGRAPVDAYGVGTRLVTGSGAPTAELIYKLVAVADGPGGEAQLHPVAKRSEAKATTGGRKTVVRALDADGRATSDRISAAATVEGSAVEDGGLVKSLQVPLVVAGEFVGSRSLEAARRHHLSARRELPRDGLRLDPGDPAIDVERDG